MNINKIIITASLFAVLVSGSAVIVQAVRNNGGEEHVGTVTAADIEAELQDKAAADAKIAELRVKADMQEEHALFQEYYDSTSDLNNTISELRAGLKTDMEGLTTASQLCSDRINAVDSGSSSQTQRRIEAEGLETEQCFINLQTVINKCNEDKSAIETATAEEYKRQEEARKAREAREAAEAAAEAAKEKEQQRNSGSSGKTGSSGASSNSYGSGSSGGSSGSSGKTGSSGSSSGSSGKSGSSGSSSGSSGKSGSSGGSSNGYGSGSSDGSSSSSMGGGNSASYGHFYAPSDDK